MLLQGLHPDTTLALQICFSPALRDSNARRQLFANAQALCRETRGHNIIVASAARSAMELRRALGLPAPICLHAEYVHATASPRPEINCCSRCRGVYDVINLATLLGLTEAQAKSAVSKSAQRVVERAVLRKAHRGAVLIRVKTAEEMAAQAKDEQQAKEQAGELQPAAEASDSLPLSFAKARLTPQKRK